jgi:hypothetical protein
MKMYGGGEEYLHAFLTSALDGGTGINVKIRIQQIDICAEGTPQPISKLQDMTEGFPFPPCGNRNIRVDMKKPRGNVQ